MSLLTDSLKSAYSEIELLKAKLAELKKKYKEAQAMMADVESRVKPKKEKRNGK